MAFVVAPPTRLYHGAAAAALAGNTLRGHADTLVGGILFSNDSGSGTIGVVLDYGGVRSVLTASHVTTIGFSPDGDTAHQATFGERSFGYEYSDPSTRNCGTWPFNYSCRNSDAAIYRLFATDTSQKGLIARTTYNNHSAAGSYTWDTSQPYFIVTSTTPNPGTGVRVDKIGYKSGWTYGTVTSTCTDLVPEGRTLTVLCNTGTDMYTDLGDSGAPVFIWDGLNQASFAGLVQGTSNGHFYFSPLSQIVGDLTSTMAITRGFNLSTPSLSGYVSGSSPTITWGSVSNATAYQVYRTWCVWNNFSCSSGSNGWQYYGQLYQSPYLDSEMTVSEYNGASVPSALTYGYVGYQIYARNGTDLSPISNAVYFTLAP